MEQKIEALAVEDSERLQEQRTWVRRHYKPEARHKYETVEGKLRLLDTILGENWVKPDETWKLQSLGIVFGDALALALDLTWVMVEDEYGRDPALLRAGSTVLLFPMTMISKRIEQGEKVDIRLLFEQVRQGTEELVAEGR